MPAKKRSTMPPIRPRTSPRTKPRTAPSLKPMGSKRRRAEERGRDRKPMSSIRQLVGNIRKSATSKRKYRSTAK